MRASLYLIILGFVFGIMAALLFKGCGKPKTVTVSKTDTVYIHVRDTSRIQPHVDAIIGGRIPDTVQVEKIVAKYYETVMYRDTGSSKYGPFYVFDTVTQNRLIGQSVVTNFQIPVTNTVVQAPVKNQLFIGINAIGSQTSFIEGFGPSAMFKLKNGKTIEAGAYVRPGGGIMYEIGLKTLIKLK